MAGTHSGSGGMVMIAATVGAVPAAVGQIDGWSIDRKTDRTETTVMRAANKTYRKGLPDMQGTVSALFDATDDALWDAAESAVPIGLYIYPDYTTAPTKYWYGPADLDMSINGSVKDSVKMSGSWAATGSWTRV